MNVEIGTGAAQFPEEEYINGIFVAVPGRATKIVSLSFLATIRLASGPSARPVAI